jgi:hypothetical protein
MNKPTMEKQRWSKMNDTAKLDCITKVLTRAGAEKDFRKACLDKDNGQTTVADEGGAIFDDGEVVKCFPDKETAEKHIMLVLPDAPAPMGKPQSAEGYWLCTYVTYNPK